MHKQKGNAYMLVLPCLDYGKHSITFNVYLYRHLDYFVTAVLRVCVLSCWPPSISHIRTAHFLALSQNFEKWLLASPCPSIFPHKTTRLLLDGFSCNLTFGYFRKSAEKIQVLLKYDKNDSYFTWRSIYNFNHISLNTFTAIVHLSRSNFSIARAPLFQLKSAT